MDFRAGEISPILRNAVKHIDLRELVRAELARQKMSVYRLAKLSGYKRATPIYRWLSGESGIVMEKLEKILQVLGL